MKKLFLLLPFIIACKQPIELVEYKKDMFRFEPVIAIVYDTRLGAWITQKRIGRKMNEPERHKDVLYVTPTQINAGKVKVKYINQIKTQL